MLETPSDPRLAYWASLIENLRWAGFLLDRDFRMAWVSPDLQRFLGSPPEEELGLGLHVFEAFAQDAWWRISTSDSRTRLIEDLASAVMDAASAENLKTDVLSDRTEHLRKAEPQPFTDAIATSFDYVEPGDESDLPVMRVNVLAMPLRSEDGEFFGVFALGYMSLRPGLVALLARGDESMYERMAKLVEPGSYEGATVLRSGRLDGPGADFADRSVLSTDPQSLDRDRRAGRANQGIVGKHAETARPPSSSTTTSALHPGRLRRRSKPLEGYTSAPRRYSARR